MLHQGLESPQRSFRWAAVAVLLAGLWCLARHVFFMGLAGSDDLHYLQFAIPFDTTPSNHWEARLLNNLLVHTSIAACGFSELAAVLPALLCGAATLACAALLAARLDGVECALTAMFIVALLPLDIEQSTTVSATTVSTALVALGTVCWLWPAAPRLVRVVAPLALSLGVVAHLSALYYVAALALAAIIVDRRRFLRPVLELAAVGTLVLGAELLVCYLVYGDALLTYRVSVAQSTSEDAGMPLFAAGRLNGWFLLWPLQSLVCGRAFGVAMAAAVVLACLSWRRLTPAHRVLLLTTILFWAWMGYGSQLPWTYRPFWRISRFLQPLVLTTAILIPAVCSSWKATRRLTLLGTISLVSILALTMRGTWGQSVSTSKELLACALGSPHLRFATDRYTLYELRVLSGLRPPANVLDAQAEQAEADALLLNPLNLKRDPTFAAFAANHAGTDMYVGQPAYRDACTLVPTLRRLEWGVRRPAARVVRCVPPTGT